MNKTTVVFPRGGGGNWLSNLIHRLETGCPPLQSQPQAGQAYDGQTRTKTLPFRHAYDIAADGSMNWYVEDGQPWWLFSTDRVFNLYLNDAVKVRLNEKFDNNIRHLTWLEQFFVFTDSAHYLLTDLDYANTYYRLIDLKLDLVFVDAPAFVDQLFKYLDLEGVVYEKNHDYAVSSCKLFVDSCPRPGNYIDNWNSVEWLAWAHTVVNISNIQLGRDLATCQSLDELALELRPYRDLCLEKTKDLYFDWP